MFNYSCSVICYNTSGGSVIILMLTVLKHDSDADGDVHSNLIRDTDSGSSGNTDVCY